MKVRVKQSEMALYKKTLADPDITFPEMVRHAYHFAMFVYCRQKAMNWDERKRYHLSKGQDDFEILKFRKQLKEL